MVRILHLWSVIVDMTVFYVMYGKTSGFPGGISGKETICQCRRLKGRVFDPWGQEDSLEEGMASLSSILAWRIPWTGAWQSPWVARVGHNLVTKPLSNNGRPGSKYLSF